MKRLEHKGLNRRTESTKMDSSLAIVNIVLLLIFFFLASGSLLASRGLAIALPDTTELPLDVLPEPLLEISNNGDMLLNGEAIAQGTLADQLQDQPVLHVLSDRDNNALVVLKALAAEGVDKVEIRLVTVHRKSDGS